MGPLEWYHRPAPPERGSFDFGDNNMLELTMGGYQRMRQQSERLDLPILMVPPTITRVHAASLSIMYPAM